MRTLRPIFCLAIAVVLSLVVADRAKAIKVLMHGREVGATFRDDPFILTHLQDKYGAVNVTYMQGSTAAADGSSATGFDVVFISSTMASGDMRNKYEDSPVGIVCDENALAHDNNVGNFFLSDAGGNQDATVQTTGRNKINILDSTHPLAAGLSGEVTVFNTTPTDTYWWQFARGQLCRASTGLRSRCWTLARRMSQATTITILRRMGPIMSCTGRISPARPRCRTTMA